MPSHHGKQKQLAKRKKKRDLAQRKPRPAALGPTQESLVREAMMFPQGPAFLSAGWDSADEQAPQLVTAVVTRVAPIGGILIPSVALVDRTCLGIKNGFLAAPAKRADLDAWLDRVAAVHGGIEEVPLLYVQSVVYHAIDYARSLGFEPHPDFPEPLFGPRPEHLRDTPLAHRARPFYMPGPEDDSAVVIQRLIRAVGEGNFDFAAGGPTLIGDLGDDEDLDEEGDE